MTYLFVQFMPPQNKPDTSFHQELYHVADNIEKKSDPHYNENQSKNSADLTDRIDLPIPDGGQGYYRHVKGIQYCPTLYYHIAGSSQSHQEYGKQNHYDEVGRAIQNTVRIYNLW
jgi:hypothetical protein